MRPVSRRHASMCWSACAVPNAEPAVHACATKIWPAPMTSASSNPLRAAMWMRPYQHRTLLAWCLAFLIPLCVFGALARVVGEREEFGFDLPLLLFLHRHATPALDRLMLACSWLGSRGVLILVDVVVLLLLFAKRRWGACLYWGLAVGGAALLNGLAKYSFARVRPNMWPTLALETSLSFGADTRSGRWRSPWLWWSWLGALQSACLRWFVGFCSPAWSGFLDCTWASTIHPTCSRDGLQPWHGLRACP